LDYELNIDVWSLGVMLFETCVHRNPFNGKTEGLQLFDIIEKLGSPTTREFEALKPRANYDTSLWAKLSKIPPKANFWEDIEKVDPTGNLKNLLEKCFKYLPEERCSAQEFVNHSFFDGFEIFKIEDPFAVEKHAQEKSSILKSSSFFQISQS